MRARDLSVGDTLHLSDRYVTITRLNPATSEATVAAGAREVFSGSWSQTFDADEHVTATPRQVREVQENAARLAAERAEDDVLRERIAAVALQAETAVIR